MLTAKVQKVVITKPQYEKEFRSRRRLVKTISTDRHLETNGVLQEDGSCKIKTKKILNADYM